MGAYLTHSQLHVCDACVAPGPRSQRHSSNCNYHPWVETSPMSLGKLHSLLLNQIPTRFALPCFPPLHVCTYFRHTPEETIPASNRTSHAAVSVWSRCHKRRECTKHSALCQLLDCSCIAAYPVGAREHSVHLLYSSSLSWISRYNGKGTSYPLLPLDRITKVHACV